MSWEMPAFMRTIVVKKLWFELLKDLICQSARTAVFKFLVIIFVYDSTFFRDTRCFTTTGFHAVKNIDGNSSLCFLNWIDVDVQVTRVKINGP